MSIKSLSVFAVLKNKRKEKERRKESEKRYRGRPILRRKLFEPSQRPRCLSFDLRKILEVTNPPELKEEEQTQEEE